MGGVLPMMKGRVMAFFEPPPELGFKLNYPEEIRPLPKTLNELEATGAVPYFNKLFSTGFILTRPVHRVGCRPCRRL